MIEGKYRIEERLGVGGQGTVYRAKHIHLERDTAFKVIRGDFLSDVNAVERFKREALALARVKHPNIVGVHDFGIEPGIGAYLVLEYLVGRSLRDLLRRQRRLPVATAVDIARQSALALHAAHKQDIIHRDVKPDNIFLEIDGDAPMVAKVLDFGVAKLREAPEQAGAPLTMSGMVLGTPLYMSPEHCTNDTLDARADVYSLGCVLYEMLTGRPPFQANGIIDLMRMHVKAPPTPPSHYVADIDPALDAAVLRSLAKRRAERFASGLEFEQELARLASQIEPSPDVISTRESGTLAPIDDDDEDSDETPTIGGPAASLDDDHASSPLPTVGRSATTPTESDATPLHTITGHSNNLPGEATSFVGRNDETEEIMGLLDSSRLVTLTGPGGCGKTRLSLHVAARLLSDFIEGVWFVELATLADPALVPQTVASALRVREESGRPLTDALVEYLQARRTLIVFDNCEHVVEACAELATLLLRACPSVKMLATSQEALGAPGEIVWAVPPLSLPDPAQALTADDIAQSEAARLFVERAKLSSPRFDLTEQNAGAVARICRSLDGIPLAIELAAARVKMLSVEQIAERLDDRFKLLTGGARTTEARQRTLRGAMEWSYELLGEPERVMFNRLSVFAGGLTIEAAESVCAGGEIDDVDVFDLLARLLDKSLVVVDEQGRSTRYRMLQTIRQYGRERLQASGEAAEVQTRHRDLYLALAEEAEGGLSGPEQADWLARLDLEHDNLRAALEWSRTDASSSDACLRLAGALPKFWYVRNYEREGIKWLEDALAADREAGPAIRAKALAGAGSLARVLRDYDRATELFDESLELRRGLGDAAGIANSLNNLAIVAQWQNDLDRAATLLDEALAQAREADDRGEIATALNNLGVVARFRGDHESAVRLFEEGLALYRALGDKRFIASTLNNLGVIAGIRGDYELSARLQTEHLALRRELGGRRGIALALNNLGETVLRKGDFRRARSLLRESLTLYKSVGDMRSIGYLLEGFVALAAGNNRSERALRLAGATTAFREATGSPLVEEESAELLQHTEAARAELGDEKADAAFAVGRGMAVDAIMAYALNDRES